MPPNLRRPTVSIVENEGYVHIQIAITRGTGFFRILIDPRDGELMTSEVRALLPAALEQQIAAVHRRPPRHSRTPQPVPVTPITRPLRGPR